MDFHDVVLNAYNGTPVRGIAGGALLNLLVVDVLSTDFGLLFGFFARSISMDVTRRLVLAELLGSCADLEKKRSDFVQNVGGDSENEKNL
jgi:hypothetical protein